MTTKIPVELSSTPGIVDGSNATAITIDSSENVGIGTSPATGVRLDIRNDSTTNIADLRNANSSGFGLYTAGGSSSSQYAFRAADKDNTALFTVKSDGNVDIADGDLSFASGHGIDFSATSDVSASSELLDDYEEGVYVATITCSTSGTASLNGAYSDLSYTKIGRLVTVTGLIIVSSVSSPVGYYSINLPFTPTDLTDRAGDSAATIIHHYGNNAGAGTYVCMINESNAYLLVYRGDVGTTRSENSAEELRAGTQLNISATYVTA